MTPSEGREPEDDLEMEHESGPATIIEVQDVTKRYGNVHALRDVFLDVRENEILAVVGDNGAGKSTFIEILAGVLEPTRGDVYYREDEALTREAFNRANSSTEGGIETVYQDLELSQKHTVAKNIFICREPLQNGIFGSLFRHVDHEQMVTRSREVLSDIGFELDPTVRVDELSGGQQQAVAVARALISDPNVVLLDEPTSEVSIENSDTILNLVEELKAHGRTIVIVSHDLQSVMRVADRVAVLRNGTLVETFVKDEDLDHETVVESITGSGVASG
jgi:ABC-type sugar transport system ATPase subunit